MLPEIKIVLYITFIASLFAFEDIGFYCAALAASLLFFLRVPPKKLKSGWIPITLFLLFTFLSNVLNRHGRILFSSGPVVVTDEGVEIASLLTLRVLLMIGGAKILMASAKPEEIVNALGRLLGPLEKVGVPVKDFFHTMGLTVKCFPILKDVAAQTYSKEIETSAARSFTEKARVVSSFLVPMFVKSIQSPEVFFERSEENGA